MHILPRLIFVYATNTKATIQFTSLTHYSTYYLTNLQVNFIFLLVALRIVYKSKKSGPKGQEDNNLQTAKYVFLATLLYII